MQEELEEIREDLVRILERLNLLLGNKVEQRTSDLLSPREMAVLSLLQQGKSNKTMAHELSIHESTVKCHLRHIMKKVGAYNRTHILCRLQQINQ
jgi:DNA-binding NarL/FixJ family response regulator